MPRQSNGQYVRLVQYAQDAHGTARQNMDPARFDLDLNDMAAAISSSATTDQINSLASQVGNAVPWSAVSPLGRALIGDPTTGAMQVTLGLGTASAHADGDYVRSDGSNPMSGSLQGPGVIASQAVQVKDTVVPTNVWSLNAASGVVRLSTAGVDVVRVSADGTAQTVRDGTGTYQQLWHAGNYAPVRTINGNTPDPSGNVIVTVGASQPANGTYQDINVLGSIWTVVNGAITNAKLDNMLPGTLKGNLGTSSGPPSDVTPDAIAQAILANASALDTFRVAATRPLPPYLSSGTIVKAPATKSHGALATFTLYGQIDSGATQVLATGPNNADLVYNTNSAHAYTFWTQVTYGGVVGPVSPAFGLAAATVPVFDPSPGGP